VCPGAARCQLAQRLMEHKDGGQERRAVCPGAARCQLAQRLMEHKDGGQERRGSLVHPRHRGLQAQDHPGLLTGSREGKKDSPGLRRADGQVVPVRLAGGAALLVWALQLLQLKRALGGGLGQRKKGYAHHRMDRGQPGEGLERGARQGTRRWWYERPRQAARLLLLLRS